MYFSSTIYCPYCPYSFIKICAIVNGIIYIVNKKLKNIIQHLSDGEFHSGAQLGKALGITRSAVWKLIRQFEGLDVEIQSVVGKGYRLPRQIELLRAAKIKKYIDQQNIDILKEMRILDEVSSTNDYLAQYSSCGKNGIYVCLAERQTGGRGRQGRKWLSPFGANIYLSLLWPFFKDAGELSGLSLMVAVSVIQVLRSLGIDKGIGLKWPNDVVWRNKKLAGVLIEVFGEAHGTCNTVIGVGLNIGMPKTCAKKIDRPWADITEITDKKVSRNKITGLLINQIINNLAIFQQDKFPAFLNLWKKSDILRGKKITIVMQNKRVNGIARGIDKSGYFLLEDEKGQLKSYSAGEISTRL